MAVQKRTGGFLPIRILPESVAFYYKDSSQNRAMRWLLRMARWPGGIERVFLGRAPDTDPLKTCYVWSRKSALDELALIHFLLNRPMRRGNFVAKNWPREPFASPHKVSGVVSRLGEASSLFSSLSRFFPEAPDTAEDPAADDALDIPDDSNLAETILCADQEPHLRGRIREPSMPDNVARDYSLKLVPLSVTGDFLCPDLLGRSDLWVHPGSPIHPPGNTAEKPHLNHLLRMSLQKGLPLLATHLISIALFEFRLEHKPFRMDKVVTRFHDLARRVRRLDFPHDERLDHNEFRNSRMNRFLRRFEKWFYLVDSKYFFKTLEYPEVELGRPMNYFWYADQASHAFYEFGLSKTDLDQFLSRETKALVVVNPQPR